MGDSQLHPEANPVTLPAPLTRFVGREVELARAPALLAEARLLTLTGPGGAGKTRLAVQLPSVVADQLDGLPLAIELAGARTRALDPTHIAAGLRERFALLQTGPRSAPRRQSTLAVSSIGASTCCPMRNGLCFASSRSLPTGSTATPLPAHAQPAAWSWWLP